MPFDARIEVDRASWDAIKLQHAFRRSLYDAMVKIGRHAENASKLVAPTDMGRLRASITHQVTEAPALITAQVGVIGGSSELAYGWYMEYGTGMQHDHPNWPRKPHVVKAGHLSAWGPVRRGILSAGAVARAITRRGGLKPRRYLRGPLERNSDRYLQIIRAFVQSVRLGDG